MAKSSTLQNPGLGQEPFSPQAKGSTGSLDSSNISRGSTNSQVGGHGCSRSMKEQKKIKRPSNSKRHPNSNVVAWNLVSGRSGQEVSLPAPASRPFYVLMWQKPPLQSLCEQKKGIWKQVAKVGSGWAEE